MISNSTLLPLTTLLKPIPGEKSAGLDLRTDLSSSSPYQKIKDARTTARHLERQQSQGIENNHTTKPDWQTIYQLALEILEKHSKDLEITAWLTEALLREYGFAGLREGFHLIRKLIETFDEQLYPLPDEDGVTTQLMPLIGLNGEGTDGTLIVPIALVELTQGHSVGPFSLWQYQQALNSNRKKTNNTTITLEMFELAANETEAEFFEQLIFNLESCLDEFSQLNQLLLKKYNEAAPPSSRIQNQLENCLECLKTIAKKPMIAESIINEEIETPINLENISNNNSSREKVLQTISQAAHYFRQAEPHSPISYLLERTVHWGRMPLPELLKEIVNDEQARMHLCALTGVKK